MAQKKKNVKQKQDIYYYKKLGDEQYELQNFPKAIEYFEKYLEQNPKDAVVCNFLGYLHTKIDYYKFAEDEIKYYKRALEIKSDYHQATRNLAFAYQKVEDYVKAIECFYKLFDSKAAVADDYYAYACLKIKLGDFEEGWKFYESRFFKEYGRTLYPQIEKPRWQGQKLENETLLVQWEQGFGDSLMFFRYLDLIKPLVKKVIFRVQDGLVELFRMNFKDIEVVGDSSPLSEIEFDYHTPLLSLPHIMQTRLENVPQIKEYLRADNEKYLKYKNEFFDNDSIKIGISWQGMIAGNAQRNIPIRTFFALAKMDGVKLYSFQKDYHQGQFEKLPEGIEIINLGETFKDFSDTAAAMANLDYFVTSDNAVFNLAASMGKKTCLLLNKFCEWRWMMDEAKTPWYNTVKIFKKQNEYDSWDILMEDVIKAISEGTLDGAN